MAWSVVGDIGQISAAGEFTATKIGVGTIVATAESRIATAHVVVASGVLASITLTPASKNMTAGQSQQFQALGLDAAGNQLAVPIDFAISGGIGTVDSGGLFTARSAGRGRSTVGGFYAVEQCNLSRTE